jgi:hypothetical protein
VYAISGKEIEDSPSVARPQLYTTTTLILNVHLQQIQEPDPLRVYM